MSTIAQMTKEELEQLIENAVERKLLELLGDPDSGLPLRKDFRQRLIRQQQAVAAGERGEPFDELVGRLGLE